MSQFDQISFMNEQSSQLIDQAFLVSCFQQLYSPLSSPENRKLADQQLMDLERIPLPLIHALLQLHTTQKDPLLSFQALVYLANVLKRTWAQRRTHQEHAAFEGAKGIVREQFLRLAVNSTRTTLPTVFDALRFIVRIDYPHHYPAFTQLSLHILQQMQQQLQDPPELLVSMTKQLREAYLQLSQRKTFFSRRYFQDHLRAVLHAAGSISMGLQQTMQEGPSRLQAKTSKYCDQILYYLIKIAPNDVLDDPEIPNVLIFLQEKLQNLLSAHRTREDRDGRYLLQKNIKSLIFDAGLLQLSKPLSLGWTLPRLYQVLFYVLTNHSLFIQPAPLRYSLIGLRRLLKEFSYYAEDSMFNSSMKGKQLPSCTMELRKQCHQFYQDSFTPEVISNLLSFLLTHPFPRSVTPDPDPAALLQKGQEKELTLEGCLTWVLQAVLERFPQLSIQLLQGLLNRALQSGDLPESTLANLFGAVALLPAACKKQSGLAEMPVLQILKLVLNSDRAAIQSKFPLIVAGWLEAFSGDQLSPLTQVLLGFMEQAAGRADEQAELLLGCCQCLDKMVTSRPQDLDLPAVVRGTVPLVLGLLGKLQNPEVLWPMVSLVAGLLSRSQLDESLLLGALEGGQLGQLVQNNSPLLVEALCEMLRGFLCVLPRERPARVVHQLVCAFLQAHLGRVEDLNYEKIFQLWYVAIREYSPIHGCDQLLRDLFQANFRKNLYRKTPTLLYTLEEYVLAELLPAQLPTIVQIILDSYAEASLMEGEEGDKVKVAALSLMITLISTRPLQDVNSDQMLRLILGDLVQQEGVSPTVRNSLLSILNRYLLRFRQPFLQYLSSLQLPLDAFFEAYFRSMLSLTSHAATKICTLAVLSFLNAFEPKFILPHLQTMFSVMLPELQLPKTYSPLVTNSPTLRFASNVLSQRKEEVRRQDGTEGVDLRLLFSTEVKTFLSRGGMGLQQLQSLVGQDLACKAANML